MGAGFAFFACCLLSFVVASHATSGRVALEPGQRREAPRGWISLKRNLGKDSNSLIDLIFALKLRNVEQLEEIFWRVSTPTSDIYGQHLTLDDIQESFRPSSNSIAVVASWIESYGVDASTACTSKAGNGFLVCTMTVSQAEALLEVSFLKYGHPSFEGGAVFRTLEVYTVPASVAAHLSFVGNVHRFPPVSDATKKDVAAQDISLRGSMVGNITVGVTPKVLRSRYNVTDITGNQPNNMQAVAQFLGQYFHQKDLGLFFQYFGDDFVHQDDVAKYIGPDLGFSGTEACLDVEYIMSLGNNISTWFWSTGNRTEGQEPFLTWIMDVANTSVVPFVHSVSYGDDEDSLDVSFMERINQEFQIQGARGLSIMFASGDSGAGCTDSGTRQFVPNFPASSPFVTTVGGTLFADFNRAEQGNSISGGGFSNVFSRPSYQESFVAHFLNTSQNLPNSKFFNHTGRGYPDVSAASNGFWIIIDTIPSPVAGTSCAAPTFSGVISLLNDLRLARKQPTLGFLNPLLYANPGALYDPVEGCNFGCGENTGFCAQAGWDPVTGLGTPDYERLSKIV